MQAGRGKLEYADLFPMIYLKMRLEGINTARRSIKHLLIDEMQDYTPVQYAVIAKLFSCNKTILGDASQSVNPYSSSNSEAIRRVFTHASCVTLTKSYRSTFEIMQFAQGISPNPDLIAVERHGEAPEVLRCRSRIEDTDQIFEMIGKFSSSEYNTLAIICKTQKQSEKLFHAVRDTGHDAQFLGAYSTSFPHGIIICTAHMAKGLEFDQVIVPDVSDKNYNTLMDRNLLYVTCTRAMHKLAVTFVGDLTRFIPQ